MSVWDIPRLGSHAPSGREISCTWPLRSDAWQGMSCKRNLEKLQHEIGAERCMNLFLFPEGNTS